MNKTIGIVGNYGHNNLGDEAILYGLIDILPKKLNKVVFTESVEKSRLEKYTFKSANFAVLRRAYLGKVTNIPKIIIDIIKSLRSVDIVIFGGGGLLNDSYKYVAFYYFFLGLVARLLGKRYLVVGISVGPLKTKQARLFSKLFLKFATAVVVRDQPSFEFSKAANLNSLKAPDLALAHKLKMMDSSRSYIAVNLIPFYNSKVWFDKNDNVYEEYLIKSLQIINHIVIQCDQKVVLFAIDFEFDSIAIKDLYQRLSKDVQKHVKIAEVKNVPDLIRIIYNAKLMYGSRLHAAVLATLCGTPFISSAYQEKVSNFAKEVGNDKYIQKLNNLDVDKVIESIDEMINNNSCFINVSAKRTCAVLDSVEEIQSFLNNTIFCE